MKIFISADLSDTNQYNAQHIKSIQKVDPAIQITIAENTRNNINKHIKDADILITSSLTDIDLVKAPNLKWIHATYAGTYEMAQKLIRTPILLTNSSGVHPMPISEQVFGYLLVFARQLNKAIADKEAHQWNQSYYGIEVFELAGKTLAIFGYGRIGQRVAKIAKAFDMKVVCLRHNRGIDDSNVDRIYESRAVNKFLGEVDFIVNCLPGTAETKHYFNLEKFQLMKKNAYFVNIGRGSTVKENDLVNALQDKVISGAALDVFETEPLPKDSRLWSVKNVIITPHNAGNTPQYINRMINIFCVNLKAYIEKKPMPNLVDKSKGY